MPELDRLVHPRWLYSTAMTKRVSQNGWQPLIIGALLLLTLLAGIFLYRAIVRASEADRMQQQASLETAISGSVSEFNNIVQEVLASFRPTPRTQNERKQAAYALELYQAWRNTTKRTQLISSLGVGVLAANGTAEFRRHYISLTGTTEQSEPIEWPNDLLAFHAALPNKPSDPPRLPPSGFAFVLSEKRPVIAIPLMTVGVDAAALPVPFSDTPRNLFGPPWARQGGTPPAQPSGATPFRGGPPPWIAQRQAPPWVNSGQRPPWAIISGRGSALRGGPALRLHLSGWCFVEFNQEYLRDLLLPELHRKHFSGVDLSQYVLTVTADSEANPVYLSDAAFSRAKTPDATQTLFVPLSRFGENFDTQLANAAPAGSVWRLSAYHRAGSLNALLQRERRNNLIIGFGLLVLLSGTVLLLTLTAQRAKALARRQMEFVAGVSHELRTPLSVIQSAGFNLAQGRVTDSARIAQYGTTIQQEGSRLSDMVEQMLSYAGIQSGRKQYEFQLVRVPDVIEKALSEYQVAFAEGGWQIEKALDADLPPVNADQQALESAVKNLLQNALKYSAAGKWLRISARQSGAEIQITISDHGPGIAAEDLRHLFEPFYRGRGLSASAIPGAGLGLSILQHHLKAHGGRIAVDSSESGAAFTLYLPLAARPANEAQHSTTASN